MTTSTFDTTLNSLGITNPSTASATAAAANASTSSTLNQSDFLTLMTAQLQNQDPFNPVDNTQMVAQMAQFSSVAGISQMNTTLSSIATKLGATSATDAMSYVGKTVLTAGNTAYARSSGGIAGQVSLAGDATDVKVTITDQTGSVLKTLSLGAQKAGNASYDWDGTTDVGAAAGNGPFTVNVAASNNGTTVGSTSLVWAPVESVSLPANGNPLLTVTGVGQVKLSDVVSVG
ncbi:flagellar hook assembly protein FlgD [Sphingomonas bacterium]|uniref:flagellar hook assembly protein FlgD n=1 Tax=Sphingomonas bacterium TaxID=1895847 RepID=UPI001576408A|nr:flagellar hook assembly protein FlgD [Sphingomonas bacterium]